CGGGKDYPGRLVGDGRRRDRILLPWRQLREGLILQQGAPLSGLIVPAYIQAMLAELPDSAQIAFNTDRMLCACALLQPMLGGDRCMCDIVNGYWQADSASGLELFRITPALVGVLYVKTVRFHKGKHREQP